MLNTVTMIISHNSITPVIVNKYILPQHTFSHVYKSSENKQLNFRVRGSFVVDLTMLLFHSQEVENESNKLSF